MGEWGARTVTLGDLAKDGLLDLGDGYRTKRAEHGKPGLPILRVAEVLDGKIVPKFEDYVSDTFRAAMGAKISQPGDIVLTTKGTVGRVAIMPSDGVDFVYSPQLCYFRVRAQCPLHPRYLYYWFKGGSFWRQALYRKSQTDMADYINLADIRSLEVEIPPMTVQQAIAAVLGALDDKIAVNERIAGTVLDLANAAYLTCVSGAFESVLVGDVMELKYGKSLPAARRVDGDVPVFGSGGVSGRHNEPLVEGPGVIVGRKGTVGSVYWSERSFFPIDTTFYVKIKRADIPMEFAYFALSNMGLDVMNSDSAVPGLNRNNVHGLPLKLPVGESVRQFGDQVRSMFELRESVYAENQTLAQLRDTLLPKLMSGQIRVRDAERMVEDAT